jgi:hypothetical protein
MYESLPIPQSLEEWRRWAEWISDPDRKQEEAGNFIGFDEFDWVVQKEPEKGWQAILAAVGNPLLEKHLGTLAAGPLEDLLSCHGEAFIDRVEAQAKSNPRFAWLLGGVWQHQMTEEIWSRVQKIWDRSGWDGNPTSAA